MSYLYTNNNLGKEKIVFNNTISSQLLTTTIADITGSTITYTPVVNCKSVIYEFKFQFEYSPDADNEFYLELFENTTGLGNYFSVQHSSSFKMMDNVINLKFILPSYSGSKTYKLRGRTLSTATEVTLHNTKNLELYYPIAKMYSVL